CRLALWRIRSAEAQPQPAQRAPVGRADPAAAGRRHIRLPLGPLAQAGGGRRVDAAGKAGAGRDPAAGSIGFPEHYQSFITRKWRGNVAISISFAEDAAEAHPMKEDERR